MSKKDTKRGNVTCWIIRNNGGVSKVVIPLEHDLQTQGFSHAKNYYFLVKKGIYLDEDNKLYSTYFEGVSTPLMLENLETTYEDREFIDPVLNKPMTQKVKVINGLKFDSEIIDVLVGRKLADVFTKIRIDKTGFIVIMLLMISLILNIIGLGLTYVYR